MKSKRQLGRRGAKLLLQLVAGLFLCSILILLRAAVPAEVDAPAHALLPAPTGLTTSTRYRPLSYSPRLAWDSDNLAIRYELEFFKEKPTALTDIEAAREAFYRTELVFQNSWNPDLRPYEEAFRGKNPIYWRVRAIDFLGVPYTPFSELMPLYLDESVPLMDAPYPDGEGEEGHLLYPVYSWTPLSGASRYTVAIYTESPVLYPEAVPIEELQTEQAEIYDPSPHYGENTFYWRVRGFDEKGEPVGKWSAVRSFRNAPSDNWQVAVFGDSISHGGGHLSYGPSVPAFSYLTYLDFPALNLSQSGDTIGMSVARFDRDVLPFHPRYLLIMTGSNSLRAGEDVDAVIDGLETIRQKCLVNGIRPILLTLPPMNPGNIALVFQEKTVDDWAARVALVNDYIRSHVHIDVAKAIPTDQGLLPTEYALDGLHPDANGKECMGRYISDHWEKARQAADAELAEGR